jgi:hypothetical protein
MPMLRHGLYVTARPRQTQGATCTSVRPRTFSLRSTPRPRRKIAVLQLRYAPNLTHLTYILKTQHTSTDHICKESAPVKTWPRHIFEISRKHHLSRTIGNGTRQEVQPLAFASIRCWNLHRHPTECLPGSDHCRHGVVEEPTLSILGCHHLPTRHGRLCSQDDTSDVVLKPLHLGASLCNALLNVCHHSCKLVPIEAMISNAINRMEQLLCVAQRWSNA